MFFAETFRPLSHSGIKTRRNSVHWRKGGQTTARTTSLIRSTKYFTHFLKSLRYNILQQPILH